MTDRELLELAGKAAGYTLRQQYLEFPVIAEELNASWNPLTDDGDALRLAVKLGILISFELYDPMLNGWGHVACAWKGQREKFESERFWDDGYAATRRAIVRAAAEIGRWMT